MLLANKNGYTIVMKVRYLFDSNGSWIAFEAGKRVFDRDGAFMGWTPWNDHPDEVVTALGEYLGTIVEKKKQHARLYRLRNRAYLGYPGRPEMPQYPGYPGHPGMIEPAALPPGAEDVTATYRVSSWA